LLQGDDIETTVPETVPEEIPEEVPASQGVNPVDTIQ
ncbi:MAG: preprotein translocase subunit SecG, partial [Eudoraea sp.]|nr:preprotein translocase subunit SecG [Eudoraea sp.]